MKPHLGGGGDTLVEEQSGGLGELTHHTEDLASLLHVP